MKQFVYPFTAIVGQEKMTQSLILNAVDPHIGGVLIKGERGSAKSTAARALADLLPDQPVVEGCLFGCDPDDPLHFCDECRTLYQDVSPQVIFRRTSFVNLPISITEDRLVGTLDFEKAIADGKKHFEPGILASVNRGILYVDEVNLLDGHIVDTLLDAAAMGINHIEREGISFSHPSRFIIIGTMNPEEGDLRPQLLDRFAHSVEIHGVTDPAERVEIISRNIAFEQDPEAFCREYEQKQNELAERIINARKALPSINYTKSDLYSIAAITAGFKLEGHRADIVILKTAKAMAAFDGRQRISGVDIRKAAELTVPHRLVSGHSLNTDLTPEEIGEKSLQILADMPKLSPAEELQEESGDKKKVLTRTIHIS